MRLPCIHELDSRDGASNKDARLVNTLVGEKDNGEQVAELRPGLSTIVTSTGNAGGLVCFNNDLISIFGANVVAGFSLTACTIPPASLWHDAAASNTTICAISSGTSAAVSSDASNWNAVSLPSAGYYTISYGSGLFVALSNQMGVNAVSNDGSAWVEYIISESLDLAYRDITHNGVLFCAVANLSTYCATSGDGVTWTRRSMPTSAAWYGIAWNGRVFCAVASGISSLGSGSNIAAISSDGINWTQTTLPATAAWIKITWNGVVFCAVAYSSNVCATSPDGVTWTLHSLPDTRLWYSVTSYGSRLIASAASSDSFAMSFDNGASWSLIPASTSGNWLFVVSGLGKVVSFKSSSTVGNVVGASTIATVADGTYDFTQSPL